MAYNKIIFEFLKCCFFLRLCICVCVLILLSANLLYSILIWLEAHWFSQPEQPEKINYHRLALTLDRQLMHGFSLRFISLSLFCLLPWSPH